MPIGTPFSLGTNNSTLNVTTLALTVGSAVAIGDVVVVYLTLRAVGSGVSFTDTKGNTYTVIESPSTGSDNSFMAWASITTALTVADTITANWTTATNAIIGALACNLGGTPNLDRHTSATGTSSTAGTTGTTTATTQANELVVSCFGWQTTGGSITFSGDTATIIVSLAITGASGLSLRMGYRIVSATGTQNDTETLASGVDIGMEGAIATFYPTAAVAQIHEMNLIGVGT